MALEDHDPMLLIFISGFTDRVTVFKVGKVAFVGGRSASVLPAVHRVHIPVSKLRQNESDLHQRPAHLDDIIPAAASFAVMEKQQ